MNIYVYMYIDTYVYKHKTVLDIHLVVGVLSERNPNAMGLW